MLRCYHTPSVQVHFYKSGWLILVSAGLELNVSIILVTDLVSTDINSLIDLL